MFTFLYFSALPSTSIYLLHLGEKYFLLQNIVQKSPPGVPGCTLLLTCCVCSLPLLLMCFSGSFPLCFVSEAAAASSVLLGEPPSPEDVGWQCWTGSCITRELVFPRPMGMEVTLGDLSCLSVDVPGGVAVAMGPPHLQLAGFGGLWLPCLKLEELQRAPGAAGEM